MADDLTFWTNPMSRGRIARWMLEEVGAPYEAIVLDYEKGEMKTEDFRAVNPMGKVPTIRHGDRIVTECAAICAYLADAFPAAGLAPAPDDRADYYRWLFFAAGPFEAAITDKMLGAEVPDDKVGMVGYGTLAHVVDTLDQALSGRDYIAGDRFTAADVYVGSQIGWQMGFGTIEKRPAFTAYVDRLYARPAHKRAVEIDDAMLPEEMRGKAG